MTDRITEGVCITLTCWHCGAGRDIIAPGHPQFGFELVGLASDAGMVGYTDMRYGRTLIFCDADHARAEMTKKGVFRMRPRGITRSALGTLEDGRTAG